MKKNESLKYYFDPSSNEKIQVKDNSDNSLIDNAFLCGLHKGPLWARLVEKIHQFPYKEMTKIMTVTINVEDMANHHKSRIKNHPQKRKIENKTQEFIRQKV